MDVYVERAVLTAIAGGLLAVVGFVLMHEVALVVREARAEMTVERRLGLEVPTSRILIAVAAPAEWKQRHKVMIEWRGRRVLLPVVIEDWHGIAIHNEALPGSGRSTDLLESSFRPGPRVIIVNNRVIPFIVEPPDDMLMESSDTNSEGAMVVPLIYTTPNGRMVHCVTVGPTGSHWSDNPVPRLTRDQIERLLLVATRVSAGGFGDPPRPEEPVGRPATQEELDQLFGRSRDLRRAPPSSH